MSGIATVFGAGGFLGRYIVRRLAQQGWRVRAAVRDPNLALFLRPYGTVGQVEPVACNIRTADSVARMVTGADLVINCVGIIAPKGPNTFQAVHVDAAGQIARLARAAGVARLVHISALGARADAPSDYQRSKAAGEAAVLAAFPSAVILRPGLMFGRDDHIFNRLAGMARMLPVLPLVGGATRVQPVWVDDVAAAATNMDAAPGVYPLAGPQVVSLHELAQDVLDVTRQPKRIVMMPEGLARTGAAVAETLGRISFGVLPVPVTRDQLLMLADDNVADAALGAGGFAPFGITPTPYGVVLPEYLWRFRPAGQFTAIRESAQRLKSR
ncbi:NADH dehydrogenase [Ketogulonicigenium robustum]|uniref:NADH dehydrogenase n=1 Tax=Ketogulonicigenium robustum TaxID=92947 RepID=A0A1W6P1R4_9RHOB|nr:complex I NDUFA9 subunit family protein [Ketogulonicigenium robustum]ARO15436.1 NADH dehydrogenase [Ketogulonicigenium robustum]